MNRYLPPSFSDDEEDGEGKTEGGKKLSKRKLRQLNRLTVAGETCAEFFLRRSSFAVLPSPSFLSLSSSLTLCSYVTELKQLVHRPDVVEEHDVAAQDPRLLIFLKVLCAAPVSITRRHTSRAHRGVPHIIYVLAIGLLTRRPPATRCPCLATGPSSVATCRCPHACRLTPGQAWH